MKIINGSDRLPEINQEVYVEVLDSNDQLYKTALRYLGKNRWERKYPKDSFTLDPKTLKWVDESDNSGTFQARVNEWMVKCFDADTCKNKSERNFRFLEESLELVQSLGCTRAEAIELVDYVYGRPLGEPQQEVGGVMVTLAALCLASDFDMNDCGEKELTRIWAFINKIREKHYSKPKNSPLPQSPTLSAEQSLISDEQIDQVFGHSNFGTMSKREVIRQALLKRIKGYSSGRTATAIISNLGLIKGEDALSDLGVSYLLASNSYTVPVELSTQNAEK